MRCGKLLGICLFAVLFFVGITACRAEEKENMLTSSAFSRGNDYYEKGEYVKAIEEYEEIRASGMESGAMYYNLGNAYFKMGELGEAVLNYERAKRIMPRDADLINNCKFARRKIKGGLVPEKGLWNWRPLRLYSENFTADEFTWLASGAFALVIIFLCVMIVRPATKRYLLIVCLLIFVFVLINAVIVWHEVVEKRASAVTTAEKAEVLFGPFDSATKFFTIQEGMKVIVLQEKNGWYKIKRADGKTGWIKRDVVEKI